MREHLTNLRRLCRNCVVLVTLVGATFFVNTQSQAQNDPIVCQHACFEAFIGCCGYYGACGGACQSTYISCGANCGWFSGRNCYTFAANYMNQCMIYGLDGCEPGDDACCGEEAHDQLGICLYP